MYHPLLCDSLLCVPFASPEAVPLKLLADEIYRTAPLPSGRDEEWKFTSLQNWHGQKISPSPKTEAPDLPQAEHARLVFINGFLSETLSSDKTTLADIGVTLQVCGYSDESYSGEDSYNDYRRFFEYLPLAALSAHSAVAPSDIIIADKACVYLELLFIGDNSGALSHHGHFLRLSIGKAAEVQLFERHISAPITKGDKAQYVHHDFLRLHVAETAQVTHHKLQLTEAEAHLGHAYVRLAAEAQYRYGVLHLGGTLARQDLHVHLCAPNAEAQVRALLLPLGAHTHHLSATMRHLHGDCRSDQEVKIIAGDKAKATYQGKVHIAEGAVGSVGHQYSRGLLLDKGSEINAKPELEIFADAVECAHGSAIGALDEEPLFYLKARGLHETQAYDLLLQAYVGAVAEFFAAAPHYAEIQRALAERMLSFADYLRQLRNI